MKGWLGKMVGISKKEESELDVATKTGPPEKPEYFLLHGKAGIKQPYLVGWDTVKVVDREFDEQLRKLRYERYAKRNPAKCKKYLREQDDPRRLYDDTLDPDHVHKFGVFRKDLKAVRSFNILSVYPGVLPDYDLVPWEWKEPIEELAAKDCQLFPYEFRLRDGTVVYMRYIINFAQGLTDSIFNAAQSGFERIKRADGTLGWSRSPAGGYENYDQKVWNGELVVKRSAIQHRHLIYGPIDYRYIFSAALREKLRNHIGKNSDFYPVHVDERA